MTQFTGVIDTNDLRRRHDSFDAEQRVLQANAPSFPLYGAAIELQSDENGALSPPFAKTEYIKQIS